MGFFQEGLRRKESLHLNITNIDLFSLEVLIKKDLKIEIYIAIIILIRSLCLNTCHLLMEKDLLTRPINMIRTGTREQEEINLLWDNAIRDMPITTKA